MKTNFCLIFCWTNMLFTVILAEQIDTSTTQIDSVITTNSENIPPDSTENSEIQKIDSVNFTNLNVSNKTSESKTDTVDASIISRSLSNIRQSFSNRLSKSRAQGYGGGIIISPMVIGLQMKPINELVRNDFILKRYIFSDLSDKYKPLLTTGAIVYGGVGKGLRIGLGGWGGEISFNSEPRNDSVMLLNTHFSYGGIQIEKAFVKKNLNYLVGGMIGFGKIAVTKSTSDNAWKKVDHDNDEEAEASFSDFSMHSGFTITLLPWMHIGLDANAVFLFSVNGFNITGCDGFTSVAPGMRLRIVLGNLG